LVFSWTDKPWFLTEEKFATVLIIGSSWGFQLGGYPARISLLQEKFVGVQPFIAAKKTKEN
jgi:hypothetical protein